MKTILVGTAILAAVFTHSAVAQQTDTPSIKNARLEKKVLSGSLSNEVRAWSTQTSEAQWLGYSVPQIGKDRMMCCVDDDGSWRHGCGPCRLEEGHNRNNIFTKDTPNNLKLEGLRTLAVLFRAENRRISKIRLVSTECELDAGGLPFLWLSDVKPLESIALLETFVHGKDLEGDEQDRGWHEALTAIAIHADPAADRALESFTQPNEPESLRRQAAFWLGAAREKAGLGLLQKMAKSDPSSEVRAHVAFALSVSHQPGALETMIRMAHEDENSHVRGQALFWLAHKAGEKAVSAITGAIDNDPDTDVKRKAVFALSQLPRDEGVPKLIEVAQTNHNREVRKQAMFWLGQSHDPRALAFFEKILLQ